MENYDQRYLDLIFESHSFVTQVHIQNYLRFYQSSLHYDFACHKLFFFFFFFFFCSWYTIHPFDSNFHYPKYLDQIHSFCQYFRLQIYGLPVTYLLCFRHRIICFCTVSNSDFRINHYLCILIGL